MCLVFAGDNALFSGNRTEIIRSCYNFNNNYIEMIANRTAVEDDKCSKDYARRQEAVRTNMVTKIGELLNKVEQVKENLKFTGNIYNVLEQLKEVVCSFKIVVMF